MHLFVFCLKLCVCVLVVFLFFFDGANHKQERLTRVKDDIESEAIETSCIQ